MFFLFGVPPFCVVSVDPLVSGAGASSVVDLLTRPLCPLPGAAAGPVEILVVVVVVVVVSPLPPPLPCGL